MSPRVIRILKEAVLTGVFAIALFTGYNLYLQKDMPSGPAPELITTQIDGNTINLEQFSEDKPVLLYFWASWCRICSWVSPSVSSLAEDYPVLGIALASGDDQRVQQYMKAKDLSFPVVNDENGEISRSWAVNVTPSIFIVRDGEIESVSTGYTSWLGMVARLWLAKW